MSPAAAGGGVVRGVGIDLVENARIREAVAQWGGRFRDRVFRAAERAYCESRPEPWRHYAGRFAVKEAVAKAFGTGIGLHVGWLDVEVGRDGESGAPRVRLLGKARAYARRRGVDRVLVSLSHTRTHTVAQAVLVGPAAGGEE